MMRSAPMKYFSVIIQEHLAHDCLEKLGELGVVQFTDMNGDLTAFKRYYTPYVKRCDDMEKKLKFFEEEMKAHGIEAMVSWRPRGRAQGQAPPRRSAFWS